MTLFEKSDRQLILQAIYDHSDKLARLGIALAQAGIPRENRRLSPRSRQANGQPEGIHESTNVGETIIAVKTPFGIHLGMIKPDYSIGERKPSTVIVLLGPNESPEPPPPGQQIIGGKIEFPENQVPPGYTLI